jgi:ATP-dependent helicase/nuclease subunit A
VRGRAPEALTRFRSKSIYRFRRADVAFYDDVKKRLLGAGAELLHLTKSLRAPPSIQHFINGAFTAAMTADTEGSEARYVPLERSRPEVAGRPTIIALPVPRDIRRLPKTDGLV